MLADNQIESLSKNNWEVTSYKLKDKYVNSKLQG